MPSLSNRTSLFALFALILFMTSCANQQQLGSVEQPISIEAATGSAQLPAFPGAEGFGQFTTGGRGGKVLYVTNLNDDGPGSFRQAVDTPGARYILFKVAGTIALRSRLNIREGNLTIAGQSAPGAGICIKDYPVVIQADNVIIRFLRFRLGDQQNQEADALEARGRSNIIVDHCSMSWSVDECVSFYDNTNTSLQWCIISESLNNSVHHKGEHGYGAIWGGKNASFHHNLIANHASRNPRLGERAGDAFALTDLTDLRNNVIYNWGANSCYGGEAMNVNIVNCYYQPGPASSNTDRIIAIDKNTKPETAVYNIWGKYYIAGNYVADSPNATADNWTYGVFDQFHSRYGEVSDEEKAAIRIPAEHPINNNVTTHSAQEAYEKVLAIGGASYVRDAVDARIVECVRDGKYTAHGSKGSTLGIIDSQEDVGGWPELATAPAPLDTSGDGMPDTWKQAHKLPVDQPQANGHELHPVYDNVEVYLHSLVEGVVGQQ
ncbi:polysaccharide lyase family 1 protein [Lewinella sp. LCG006]|uniref:pectate lyase family protein n=1 Tax=Lewinella sp. LCG006 TaxID=3231911 RepID=UPI00345FBA84